MDYSEWNEHIGFVGWNAPIGTSLWDVEDLEPCDTEEDQEDEAQRNHLPLVLPGDQR